MSSYEKRRWKRVDVGPEADSVAGGRRRLQRARSCGDSDDVEGGFSWECVKRRVARQSSGV